jgi:hypothetical protein
MGMTGLRTRDVLLNFDLFKHYDWVIRFVFAHEIGHCVHGFSETKATRWAKEWASTLPGQIITPETEV